MKKEVTAIIVSRKGSVRIPAKGLQKIGSQTLIEHKIKQLKLCKNIDRIVFGSNCDEMLELAASCGAETVKRPDFYCDETKVSANLMIENMLSLLKTDICVWAHCTNPLIAPNTYDRAVETFIANKPEYDSLLSVVEYREHLWDQNKKPINYNPYKTEHTPAARLPLYYQQDGGIFIMDYNDMKSVKYFFGKKPFLFIIPDSEYCDINTPKDLIIANALLSV